MLLDLYSSVIGGIVGYFLGFMTIVMISMSSKVSREEEKHE